jgi:hypothetical protein
MRLRIAWGGTAEYNFGINGAVSRQTQNGASFLPILLRNGKAVLGAQYNWNLRTLAPQQPKGVTAHFADELPFGNGTQFFGKVLSVDNEYDLHQDRGSSVASVSGTHLFLLTPAWYTKADNAASAENGTNYEFTDDAVVSSLVDADIYQSLSHRFILWTSDVSDPHQVAPSFTAAGIKNWNPAYVFANQTWISAEIPIETKGGALEWQPVGATWLDIVQTYFPEALVTDAATPGRPLMTIRRLASDTHSHGGGGAHGHQGKTVELFRFWSASVGSLERIQCDIGDSFK